jgi:hypothetical protein
MAPGGQGARPGPGMPGAPARPPGWRRRGCRRPPRTGRTARGRRSATRRSHQAGPVRSRHGGLLRPALRTGALCFAGRRTCAQAGTVRVVPPRAAGRPGWPRTSPARPRRHEGNLAGEGVISRMQGRKFTQQLQDVKVAGEPVEQDTAGGHGVRGDGPLPGGHISTVGQNQRSPGGLGQARPGPRPGLDPRPHRLAAPHRHNEALGTVPARPQPALPPLRPAPDFPHVDGPSPGDRPRSHRDLLGLAVTANACGLSGSPQPPMRDSDNRRSLGCG